MKPPPIPNYEGERVLNLTRQLLAMEVSDASLMFFFIQLISQLEKNREIGIEVTALIKSRRPSLFELICTCNVEIKQILDKVGTRYPGAGREPNES